MKTPLLIVLGAIVLMAGSGLAIMNNACKSNHHAWCAQMSDMRHHVKSKDDEAGYLRWLAINHPGYYASLYGRLIPRSARKQRRVRV
jgi:hypothetical protein